jgi:hypothetical protein
MNLKIAASPVLSGLPASLTGSTGFLLPIMWFEDAIEKIPDDLSEMLKEALRDRCYKTPFRPKTLSNKFSFSNFGQTSKNTRFKFIRV